MMNSFLVTIDQGNTNTSCALFDNSLENPKILKTFSLEKLDETTNQYALDAQNTKAIICSVKKELGFELKFEDIKIKDLFKNNLFIDMPVSYSETLGLDRLAITYSLYKKNNKPFICIDTGTFTTIDLVDIRGFGGGYILPGLQILQDSYKKGDELFSPNTTSTQVLSANMQIPKTTKSAIEHGAFFSYIAPINRIIEHLDRQDIIITGGNGEILFKALSKINDAQKMSPKRSIQLEKDLIHKSLIYIFKMVNK